MENMRKINFSYVSSFPHEIMMFVNSLINMKNLMILKMNFLNLNEDTFINLSNLLITSESLRVLDLSYNSFYEKYV